MWWRVKKKGKVENKQDNKGETVSNILSKERLTLEVQIKVELRCKLVWPCSDGEENGIKEVNRHQQLQKVDDIFKYLNIRDPKTYKSLQTIEKWFSYCRPLRKDLRCEREEFLKIRNKVTKDRN